MNYYDDNQSLRFQLEHPEVRRIAEMQERGFAEYGKYADAPKDVDEALDGYDKVLRLAGEVAAEVLAENAQAVDQEGPHLENGRVTYAAGTKQNWDTLQQSGLCGLKEPRQYNGLNMPNTVAVLVGEMIARADVGFTTIWMLQDCADTIENFASEEIKAKFLPMIYEGKTCSMDLTEPDAGSDLQSVRLKATYDETEGCWRLNGVKRFISNGDADIHLVLARSEEGTSDGRGLSYFVYDKRDGGVTVRRIEHKMGIIGSPTCELVFNNARAELIGERRFGLIKYTMALMNGARLGVGAQAVGLCECATREAVAYAATREQFGKTIDQMIPVQEILSTMRAKTDGARALLYETTRQVDLTACYERILRERPLNGDERKEYKAVKRNADLLTPLTKMFASEYSNQNAYDCIQVHGGSGFMKEYTCERLYRDARILSIYEGTTQLQVVAATKGIGNGAYMNIIAEYDAKIAETLCDDAATPCRDDACVVSLTTLRQMTSDCREMMEGLEGERFEHNVRRIVEVIGYIIMGYLMLMDAQRDERFMESARRIIALGAETTAKHKCGMKF